MPISSPPLYCYLSVFVDLVVTMYVAQVTVVDEDVLVEGVEKASLGLGRHDRELIQIKIIKIVKGVKLCE